MKKLKDLKITPSELLAICDLTDSMSAMMGCGDPEFDAQGKKQIRLIDRMLKKNGYKRDYK